MEVKAYAKLIRMSPYKIRLVTDLVRGMDVKEAMDTLAFLNKVAAKPVRKLLASALANAEHNFQLQPQNLYVKKIVADQGPVFKRWTPKAFGRAALIRRRTAHISIVLDERVPTKKLSKRKEEVATTLQSKPLQKEEAMVEIKPDSVRLEQSEHTAPLKEISDVSHRGVTPDPRMQGKHRHKENEDKKMLSSSKGKGSKFVNKIFNRKSG